MVLLSASVERFSVSRMRDLKKMFVSVLLSPSVERFTVSRMRYFCFGLSKNMLSPKIYKYLKFIKLPYHSQVSRALDMLPNLAYRHLWQIKLIYYHCIAVKQLCCKTLTFRFLLCRCLNTFWRFLSTDPHCKISCFI